MAIDSFKKVQTKAQTQTQVEILLFDKTSTTVLVEYFDYSNVFLIENIMKFSEHTGINDYAIKLEKSKYPSFRPIYSLGLVELETLKTYIKANLANSFIWPFKFSANALILFDRKPDNSL